MPTTSAVLRPLNPCSVGTTVSVASPVVSLSAAIVVTPPRGVAPCARPQVPPAKLPRRDQYGADPPVCPPPVGNQVATLPRANSLHPWESGRDGPRPASRARAGTPWPSALGDRP